ncbi:heme-binding protein [Kordiimonas sp. SCSIO 12610]|uniref:GlcG/HbpS family heme-binding protein n=1 Tax=Kordiimonas sp. SCSIO 12610 TaxID=2829597 RepID=UPI002109C9B0|nr:heme-binding protein [Kordiimonas sp. SCSIO 12610]UTW55943.1 heme-binding protein [Kordiimonas sp. SCSIO 12610]
MMKKKMIGKTFAVAAVITGLSAFGLSAQDMRPVLNSASAKKITEGCEAYALDHDLKVNIAVLDQGTNMMAFLRMDGAPIGSIDIAEWKANSSAASGRPTKARFEAAKNFPAIGHAPNIAVFEGGEPIFTLDGVLLGGVGVSGAASADDAACARAGIEAAGLTFKR